MRWEKERGSAILITLVFVVVFLLLLAVIFSIYLSEVSVYVAQKYRYEAELAVRDLGAVYSALENYSLSDANYDPSDTFGIRFSKELPDGKVFTRDEYLTFYPMYSSYTDYFPQGAMYAYIKFSESATNPVPTVYALYALPKRGQTEEDLKSLMLATMSGVFPLVGEYRDRKAYAEFAMYSKGYATLGNVSNITSDYGPYARLSGDIVFLGKDENYENDVIHFEGVPAAWTVYRNSGEVSSGDAGDLMDTLILGNFYFGGADIAVTSNNYRYTNRNSDTVNTNDYFAVIAKEDYKSKPSSGLYYEDNAKSMWHTIYDLYSPVDTTTTSANALFNIIFRGDVEVSSDYAVKTIEYLFGEGDPDDSTDPTDPWDRLVGDENPSIAYAASARYRAYKDGNRLVVGAEPISEWIWGEDDVYDPLREWENDINRPDFVTLVGGGNYDDVVDACDEYSYYARNKLWRYIIVTLYIGTDGHQHMLISHGGKGLPVSRDDLYGSSYTCREGVESEYGLVQYGPIYDVDLTEASSDGKKLLVDFTGYDYVTFVPPCAVSVFPVSGWGVDYRVEPLWGDAEIGGEKVCSATTLSGYNVYEVGLKVNPLARDTDYNPNWQYEWTHYVYPLSGKQFKSLRKSRNWKYTDVRGNKHWAEPYQANWQNVNMYNMKVTFVVGKAYIASNIVPMPDGNKIDIFEQDLKYVTPADYRLLTDVDIPSAKGYPDGEVMAIYGYGNVAFMAYTCADGEYSSQVKYLDCHGSNMYGFRFPIDTTNKLSSSFDNKDLNYLSDADDVTAYFGWDLLFYSHAISVYGSWGLLSVNDSYPYTLENFKKIGTLASAKANLNMICSGCSVGYQGFLGNRYYLIADNPITNPPAYWLVPPKDYRSVKIHDYRMGR